MEGVNMCSEETKRVTISLNVDVIRKLEEVRNCYGLTKSQCIAMLISNAFSQIQKKGE